MNNGGFGIFQSPNSVSNLTRMCKRSSVLKAEEKKKDDIWNARDEMRLLDAVEQVSTDGKFYFLNFESLNIISKWC